MSVKSTMPANETETNRRIKKKKKKKISVPGVSSPANTFLSVCAWLHVLQLYDCAGFPVGASNSLNAYDRQSISIPKYPP